MPYSHAREQRHKATAPDVTSSDVKREVKLGAARGVGTAIVTLILWGLRNII
ncbi:hypothetical protein ACWERV_16995 [Streptomyces sp. NPDC004031]